MDIFIDFTVFILIYFLFFFRKWHRRGKDILLINTTMYIYLVFVFYFTLMPILTSLPFVLNHPYTPMNLQPFIDVSYGRGDYTRQIILNIIMTIPFGFLFPLVYRQNRTHGPSSNSEPTRSERTNTLTYPSVFFQTILCTFLLSFSIEIIQPLLNDCRSSDITDVITNVLGGFIGYLCYLVVRPIAFRLLDQLRDHIQKSTT